MTIALRQLGLQYQSYLRRRGNLSFADWLQMTVTTYVKNHPDDKAPAAGPQVDPDLDPAKWLVEAYELLESGSPAGFLAGQIAEHLWGWLFEIGATLPDDIQKVLETPAPPPDAGVPISEADDGGTGGGDGGGCFAAGTLIATPNGLRAIETIGMDDDVLAQSEEVRVACVQRVSRTWRHEDRPTLVIHLANGEQITTTAPHRFFVRDRGFVAAKRLNVGDRVTTRADQDLEIIRIDIDMPARTVYNLSVDNAHTYFVGETQVWVHNVKEEGNPDDEDDGEDGGGTDTGTAYAKAAAKVPKKSKP